MNAYTGSFPNNLNTKKPVTSIPVAASTGETTLIIEEGVARRSSLSMSSLHVGMRRCRAVACVIAELSAHPYSDLFDGCFRRLHRRRKCPAASTASRSLIVNSSSDSSDITEHRDALIAQINQRLPINCAAPTSTPHVGWATIIILGCNIVSLPTMNFCRLPPNRLEATDCSSPHLTLKRSITFLEKSS